MNRYADIEEKTREIGLAIHDSVGAEVPAFFDRKRWTGRIMERVMGDEDFKVRLFRFIDLLPALRSDHLIVRMLNEYFSDETDIPLLIRQGIRRLSDKRLLPHLAAGVVRSGIESLAREFIAGSNPEESAGALEALEREGADYSIDLLGEVVVSNREADLYRAKYLALLEFMGKQGRKRPRPASKTPGQSPAFDISLKVSSLYSQLNPLNWEGSIAHAREGLRPIFNKAAEIGASITFDMEHSHLKDLILFIFRDMLEEFNVKPMAGVAIQAYLRSARKDLLELIGWARKNKRTVTVRLVKGAYWDYEVALNRQRGWPVPVFLIKEDTDRNFEDLTRLCFENADCIRPAIATHNIRSLSYALAVSKALAVPAEAFEFQMLYGMAGPLRKALEKMGNRIRVYSPIGEFLPGMAYLIRRLLENTSNESFLRRSFLEKRSFEELIRAPAPAGQSTDEKQQNIFRNEPALDFSLASNREAMREALRKIRGNFGSKYPLVFGGKEVLTKDQMVSVNPSAPEEVIGRVSVADRSAADTAVSEARRKWGLWRDVPAKEKADYLVKAAGIMRKDRYTLAALEVCEVGKTWEDADGDVTEAIDYLEYYSREMLRLEQPLRLGDYPGEENEYCYASKGVGIVISPWNFPLAIPAGMVSAAIVAGNCVIFKPSGLSPVTGYMLFDIFRRAGLPDGVLQFLPGPGSDVGEHLVAHPGTDFVVFTGSKDVGTKIIGLAGRAVSGQRSVKKVIAEMGGKNAIIVDGTADLDEAIKGVLESCLGYQGQKCSACSRVIVVEEVYDEFSRRFSEAVESIDIGPPEDPAFFIGPLIDKIALERIRQFKQMGKKQGRTVLFRSVEGKGYFAGPAIFSDLPSDSALLSEEIFGPVIALLRAKDFDEALDIALSSPYALTGGLFSRSPQSIIRARKAFRVGNLYINRKITGALVGRQPFGGFGMSGVGSKAGGPDYLLQFMDPRSISENTLRKGFAPKMP